MGDGERGVGEGVCNRERERGGERRIREWGTETETKTEKQLINSHRRKERKKESGKQPNNNNNKN